MVKGEGEQLHDRRRRNFWKILGALALVGGFCGFLAGAVKGYADASGARIDPLLMQFGAVGVVLAALLAIYFSWKFFVSVDEVEVADNLWGSLIGFYAYAILFPVWWALEQLQVAPPPDHWLIYGLSMITALVAYGYRKWLLR
jgi:hypothetical protein